MIVCSIGCKLVASGVPIPPVNKRIRIENIVTGNNGDDLSRILLWHGMMSKIAASTFPSFAIRGWLQDPLWFIEKAHK